MATLEFIKKSKDLPYTTAHNPYTTPLRVKILDTKKVDNKQHIVLGDTTGIIMLKLRT